MSEHAERLVHVRVDSLSLEGALAVPPGAGGVVLFAHGSGSSRRSPRNNFVARELRAGGLGTLLIDLLTEQEDASRQTRFDIDLLTQRLLAVTEWLRSEPDTKALPLGYFGASTGAAAALKAAATLGPDVYRAAADPISPRPTSRASRPRRCSSSAAMTTWCSI
jgi:dienelactone hydrolase